MEAVLQGRNWKYNEDLRPFVFQLPLGPPQAQLLPLEHPLLVSEHLHAEFLAL